MRLLHLHKKFLTSTKTAFKGYSHLQTLKAQDLNLQITRHLHQKSGAMIYNIKSNDNDNTFAPIVRTLPQNSTGCPHILQHLSCCGSVKYPIRDPFFNMLRRSVNTYMNAWTGDDFTAYPFSSANGKDFQNLYQVYLDMCLKPLLNQLDFRQQGWRYQYNNVQNKQKQIKGIVFNQMKGAYQNPDRQLYIQIASKLFANTPYGYDSGGKPQQIIKLSYQQVQNMHKYYYHPSNMSFYYYGNANIQDKLTYLQSQYLLKYNYKNTIIQHQQKSKKLLQNMPQNMSQIFYTVNSQTAQTPNIAITYNIGMLDKIQSVDITCLNILSYLLLQTNQAIFYQQFIQAQLADSFGMSGFNIGSILSFSLTLKNVNIEHEEVLKRVQKCLQNIIENGVNQSRLEEYIRQTQLDILTPKQTQGIVYLSNCMPYMINRLPLYNLVNIRGNLNTAVKKLKSKSQLQKLIQKYFLNNRRKIAIKQNPSKSKVEDTSKTLIGLQMSQQIIKTQQQQLKIRQQSVSQNSAQCLPKLFLKDLQNRIQKQFNIKKQGNNKLNNTFKQIHVGIDIPDINFIRLVFKLDMNNQQHHKLLKHLDIWKYTIKQGIAVAGLSNKQLSSKLNICSNQFTIAIQKPSPILQPSCINIVFSASCLNKNIEQYLKLLHKIIFQPQFKQQDIQNIFRSYKSEKVQQLLDGSVMQYCLDYSASFLGKQSQIFNTYQWVTQGIKIAELGKVPQQFKNIHEQLRSHSDITLIQHSRQYKSSLLEQLGFKYNNQKSTGNSSLRRQPIKNNNFVLQQNKQIAVTNSYDVNFCTEQYVGPQFLTQQHAHISLLVQVLQQDYLHPKIREKGGAYGAKAVYRDAGTIALYSYMDPYSTETYHAFQQSIKEILELSLNNQRLEEVKIKVIGGLEVPLTPQKQCLSRILKSYTIQQRKKLIDYIKQAQWPEIVKTGKKYLLNKNKSRVMFGKDIPKQFLEQKLKIPKQQVSEENN